MSSNWSQGSQHSGPPAQGNNFGGPLQGPAPICFNCQGEHYLVNCPEPKRTTPAGLSAAPVVNTIPQQGYGPGPSGGVTGQRQQWNNDQPPPVAQYSKVPSGSARYAVPNAGAPPQFNNPAPYGQPAVAPPYQQPPQQQYPNLAPPVHPYQPSQPAYPPSTQQYRPNGSSVPYQPPPQPYNGARPLPQYNPGYEAPPQNQYPQSNGPPQYGTPSYQNPQQYTAPPPVPLYSPPAAGYPQNGSYSGPSPPPNQPPQWNGAQNSSYVPPMPQPNGTQYNNGFNREYSGPPQQRSRSQSFQPSNPTPQGDFRAESHHATPLISTPQSIATNPTPATRSRDDLSAIRQISGRSMKSNGSNSGSFSDVRPGSSSSNQTMKMPSASPAIKTTDAIDVMMSDIPKFEKEESNSEDGEDEEFKWSLSVIFQEQPMTENVRLAQPLSTTWESTPVPLLDARLNNSTSRYARKENLKDFMRPIRSQPQWDYLKEDPAFADTALEGELIPLDEVLNWMAARQGTEVTETQRPSSSSRKRQRSEENQDEQSDIDNQIQQEQATEVQVIQVAGMPNKRQKNEEPEHIDVSEPFEGDTDDTVVVQIPSPETVGLGTPTVAPGTPTVARSGTPSLNTEDDVWAPQPGETSEAPQDPTEVLLASLGVSGSPKPIRRSTESLAGDSPSNADQHSNSSPLAVHPTESSNPQSQDSSAYYNAQGMPQQYDNHSQYEPPQGQYQNGGPPPANGPYGYQQYDMPRQNSYGSGPSQHVNPAYPNPPHGIPRQNSYGNAASQQGGPQYGTQQYGIPRQNSYGNGAPYQAAPPYANGQGPPQQYYPPQNQYGPPNPPYNPQYGPNPNDPQYGNAPYGMPPQQYPPQNQYVNGMYNGMPPQNNGPYSQSNGYGNPNAGYPPNGPHQQPNPTYQQYNNGPAPQPPRQDSGYMSAGGSYSNGSSTNHGLPSTQPTTQQKPTPKPQAQRSGGIDGSDDTPPRTKPEVETNFFASLPSQFPRTDKSKASKLKVKTLEINTADKEEDDKDDSPLTPTSLEILGKLLPTHDSNGKKIDRKTKRPQPVVEAAYSRRW